MRIIVLENEPSSQRGGQELSLVDVCERLAARGHEILFLYVTAGDLLSRYEKFCRKILRVSGYDIDRRHALKSSGRWSHSFLKVAFEYRDADLIYANQYHDTLFAGLVAQWLRRPFVCHLRLLPPVPICGQWRLGLERATRLITISEANRREWIGLNVPADRIDLVYNGIDPERHRAPGTREQTRATLGLAPDVFTPIFIGRLDTTKGVELLLEGFAEFHQRHVKSHLLVVGAPHYFPTAKAKEDYFGSLRNRARAHGIGEAVSWLGRRSDINALCEASDVLVLPSRRTEAFGRTIIEAMACGIPAIGSRVGGIPEVLTGEFAQYVFPDGDAAQLAGQLAGLVDWRRRDPDLARRCREHVLNHFTLETVADGVEATMRKAVQTGFSRWRGVRWQANAVPRT